MPLFRQGARFPIEAKQLQLFVGELRPRFSEGEIEEFADRHMEFFREKREHLHKGGGSAATPVVHRLFGKTARPLEGGVALVFGGNQEQKTLADRLAVLIFHR